MACDSADHARASRAAGGGAAGHYGWHASVLIQVAGIDILTDPVWADRASRLSFVGPRRATAPGIDFDDLPPIDAVLISHNHYDHLDVATLRRLQVAHAPLMVMPLGHDAIVRAAVPSARIAIGDWHDRFEIDHSDARQPLVRAVLPTDEWRCVRRPAKGSALWVHVSVWR